MYGQMEVYFSWKINQRNTYLPTELVPKINGMVFDQFSKKVILIVFRQFLSHWHDVCTYDAF